MAARTAGLGHVGLYVRDLEKMVAFYRDFLGLQITMQDWTRGIVLLSSDPERVDHEIALIRGRPQDDGSRQVEQISMRVNQLRDVREFYHRLVDAGFRIDKVVNHCGAIGCYYFDPEGNRSEVFWDTGRHSNAGVPFLELLDIDQPDEAIMAHVERSYERLQERAPQPQPAA